MIERILFPVDFSERCAAAAPHVQAMAARLGAEVHLLHAMTAGEYLLGARGFPAEGANLYTRHIEEVRRKLAAFEAERFPVGPCPRAISEGDPALRIVEYAREHGIGMVMLPAHGLGGFRRRVIGSAAAEVMRVAAWPVWTCVHPELAPSLPEKVIAMDARAEEFGARLAAALDVEFARTAPAEADAASLAVIARGSGLPLDEIRCPIVQVP